MKLTHVIYKLTFPNGKVYIGQTCNMVKRMSNYKQESVNRSSAVHNAVCKYGWSSVTIEIVKRCTIGRVDFWERKFIKQFKANIKGIGYNLESGGHKNKILSLEIRKKLSENHHMRGVFGKDNPDSKAVVQIDRFSGLVIKRWESIADASRALKIATSAISKACRGILRRAGNFVWVYYSEYSKVLVSSKLKKFKEPFPTSTPVLQIELNSGNIVKRWKSMREVELILGIPVQNISKICNKTSDRDGYLRYTAGGYGWKFDNN